MAFSLTTERERFDRGGKSAVQLWNGGSCRELPRLPFEVSLSVNGEGGRWSDAKTPEAILPGRLLSLGNTGQRRPSGGAVDHVADSPKCRLVKDEGKATVRIWRARRYVHVTSAASGDERAKD